MSNLITPFYKIIDFLCLTISGFTFMNLIGNKHLDLPEVSVIQWVGVSLTISWYIFMFVRSAVLRKENKKQRRLITENLEIENEIKKAMLLKVKEGNIDEIINELEERQKEMINNNKDD